jgi:hypothetical protein
VGEHCRAVRLDVLVEPQAGRGLRQHQGERDLAHIERLARRVVTVEFDQVKGVEECAPIMPPIADAIEAWHAVVAATHRLAVARQGAFI